jgi:hypothetical protein
MAGSVTIISLSDTGIAGTFELVADSLARGSLILTVFWGLLYAVVIRGRLQLDPSNPALLHTNQHRYELRSFTGEIRASQVRTHVSGAGGDSPVRTTHPTTRRASFIITCADGREVPFEGANVNFPVRDGHIVSVTRAWRSGQTRTLDILLRNHTLRSVLWQDRSLRRLERELPWPQRLILIGGLLLIVLGALATGGALVIPILALFVPAVIVEHIVRHHRRNRAKQDLAARHLPLLDQAAADTSMTNCGNRYPVGLARR